MPLDDLAQKAMRGVRALRAFLTLPPPHDGEPSKIEPKRLRSDSHMLLVFTLPLVLGRSVERVTALPKRLCEVHMYFGWHGHISGLSYMFTAGYDSASHVLVP